jgi:hypothetical protein
MEDEGQKWNTAGVNGTGSATEAASAGHVYEYLAGKQFREIHNLDWASKPPPTYTPPPAFTPPPRTTSTIGRTSRLYESPNTDTRVPTISAVKAGYPTEPFQPVSPSHVFGRHRAKVVNAWAGPIPRHGWLWWGWVLLAFLAMAAVYVYLRAEHRQPAAVNIAAQKAQTASELVPVGKVEAYVVAKELNVRDAPTAHGSIVLGTLSCGQKVLTQDGIANGWTAIDFAESTAQAYVSSLYLSTTPPQTGCQ